MTDDAPVDEIFGVKNWQSWRRIETGSGQIEVVTNTHNIWIRVVSVNDRVLVGAVPVVRRPDRLGGRKRSEQQEGDDCRFEFADGPLPRNVSSFAFRVSSFVRPLVHSQT